MRKVFIINIPSCSMIPVKYLTSWCVFVLGLSYLCAHPPLQLMDDFLVRFATCGTEGVASTCSFSRVREGLIVALLSIGTLIGALLGARCVHSPSIPFSPIELKFHIIVESQTL